MAAELGCTRYVQGPSLKGQADVDPADPKARQRFFAEIAAHAEQVLDVVRGTRATLVDHRPEDHDLLAAADLPVRILAQDIERGAHGPHSNAAWLPLAWSRCTTRDAPQA